MRRAELLFCISKWTLDCGLWTVTYCVSYRYQQLSAQVFFGLSLEGPVFDEYFQGPHCTACFSLKNVMAKRRQWMLRGNYSPISHLRDAVVESLYDAISAIPNHGIDWYRTADQHVHV